MGRNNERNIKKHNDKLHKAQNKVKQAEIARKEKLKEIKRNGYNLEFGDVFNDSMEIYKKVIWITGFAFFILMAAFLVLYFAIMAFFFTTDNFINTMTEISLMEGSVTFMAYTMLLTIVLSVAISPMYAGVLQVCHNAKNNKEFDLSTIFIHYKTGSVKEIIISSLLIALFLASILLNFLICLKGNQCLIIFTYR